MNKKNSIFYIATFVTLISCSENARTRPGGSGTPNDENQTVQAGGPTNSPSPDPTPQTNSTPKKQPVATKSPAPGTGPDGTATGTTTDTPTATCPYTDEVACQTWDALHGTGESFYKK